MIDFRIYRAGFAPALVAVVVLLFALTAPPDPLPTVVAPAGFDEVAASKIARQIVDQAPDRTPGSEGDQAIADMILSRFKHVTEGEVSQQQFSAEFNGNDVQLRNVILTLPGDSARSVVILAPRDSASGPGAASSAAATATLLQLVDQMRSLRHSKTLVFVSTDGSSAGAAGAREFAQAYPQRDQIDAAIDLWQPGFVNPRPPFVLDSSDGPQSPSAQLVRTAERELSDQTDHKQGGEGVLAELAGLALPSGLGEQAVLIDSGLTAIGLSSAGERPLPASQDQPSDLSPSTLGDFGRTALLLTTSVDGTEDPLAHGPATYVTLAGNLVPGWTLTLLALALLFPAALAAGDGIRRAALSHARVGWALAWSGSRAMPPFVALLLLYFLTFVGLVASPTYPFDPNLFGVGVGQVIAMVFLGVVIVGGYYAIRAWRVPSALPRAAVAPALGAVSTFAVFIAWLANPYLGLLLVPVAHVWLTCAHRRGPLPWPAVVAAAVISLTPIVAALDHLSGALSLGSAAPWLLVLMVGDGQFGFGMMLALCLTAGSLIGIVALSLRRPAPRRPHRTGPRPSTGPAEPDAGPEPVGSSASGLDRSTIALPGPDDDQRYDR